MSIVLAHHLELHHIPVLVGLFAAGFFVGWQLLSQRLRHGRAASPTSHDANG
jgi:hypothetical protein